MLVHQAISLSKNLYGTTWVKNNFRDNDYYVGLIRKGRQFQIQTDSFKDNTHKLVEVGIGGTSAFNVVECGSLVDVISALDSVAPV